MRLARIRAAYPKLTLSLRVLAVDLTATTTSEGLVVSLGQPQDVIEAYARPAPGACSSDGARRHDARHPRRPPQPRFIAAEKLLVRRALGSRVRLVLRKHIPMGAGLGGGSADAAAALLAVRRLLDVDIDDDGVLELAAETGSDVPFCVRGGAAWMRGRGELLEPVALPQRIGFLLAIPPFRLATPDVYRAWDELGGPEAQRVVPAPRRLAGLVSELANDLEPAAEAVEPRLRKFRRALEEAAGGPALMAGSGSSYVVPVPDARKLPALVDDVRRKLRVPVLGTTNVTRGVRMSA
jgi:4-diphosphocytidyl-2-C-methyl-D-erythritol kinase